MSWWFHLLVRRVENLRARCDVAERVFRAVGPVRYAERMDVILVRFRFQRGVGVFFYSVTVNDIKHSVADIPSYIDLSVKGRTWRKGGKLHREGGRPARITDSMAEWWDNGVLRIQTEEKLGGRFYFFR